MEEQAYTSALTTASAFFAVAYGTASRAMARNGIEIETAMQDNVALAITARENTPITIKIPKETKPIQLYDLSKFNIDLDRQNELIEKSQTAGLLTAVLTEDREETEYGVEHSQSHANIKTSQTTYTGINPDVRPKQKKIFLKNYNTLKTPRYMGYDYIIMNHNKQALEDLKKKYTYYGD